MTLRRPENVDGADQLTRSVNMVYNGVLLYGYGITQNRERIVELNNRTTLLASRDYVKGKHHRLKTRVINSIEECKKYLEGTMEDGFTRQAERISSWEDKLQLLEKKTLWKLIDMDE